MAGYTISSVCSVIGVSVAGNLPACAAACLQACVLLITLRHCNALCHLTSRHSTDYRAYRRDIGNHAQVFHLTIIHQLCNCRTIGVTYENCSQCHLPAHVNEKKIFIWTFFHIEKTEKDSIHSIITLNLSIQILFDSIPWTLAWLRYSTSNTHAESYN